MESRNLYLKRSAWASRRHTTPLSCKDGRKAVASTCRSYSGKNQARVATRDSSAVSFKEIKMNKPLVD